MRPLLVLVLVLGAVAALIFGLVNLRTDAPPETVDAPVGAPADPKPTATPALVGDGGGGADTRQTSPASASADDRRATGDAKAYVYDNALTGVVRNPAGAPLRDVEVTLTKVGGSELFFANDPVDRSADVTVRTDAEGRFQFRRIEPRHSYQLIAVHPDFTRKEVSSVPVGQQGTFEEPPITMSEGATLKGYVRDAQQNPIQDAELALEGLMYQASPYAAPDRMTVKTNNDGYYAFTNVPKGQRTLTVVAPGHGRLTINGLAFDAEETVTRDVVLQIGEMIRGRVVGPGNVGLPGARVMALGFSNTQQTARSETTTDERGEFLFEDLSPGDYNVVGNLKGYRAERALRVRTNGDAVVIEMFKEASVCGQVIDAATGQPVPSFTIRMRFHYGDNVATSPSELSQSFNSPNGEFCIEGVPTSEYVAEASAPGFAPSFSPHFSVPQGKNVTGITIRLAAGGSISGRVVDAEGKPVARARVTTHDKEWTDDEFTRSLGPSFPTNATSAEVRTADDGTFTIRNLTPETYQVQIQAGGYTSFARHDVAVSDGVETKMNDIRLSRGGTLRGTLFDPSGKGLVGGQIHVRPTDGSTPNFYQTKSGADGRYAVTNIAPGRYVVTASRAAGAEVNPFEQLTDLKNSERQVVITEGSETVQDLSLTD